MENLSGHVIKGYELRDRSGAGGFGAVYKAHQSTVGREVAIKIILPHFSNHPDFIRRFETEAQLIARLEHLHIVPLYDYWRDGDGAYLVMRWLRGGSLREVLQVERLYKHLNDPLPEISTLPVNLAEETAISRLYGGIHFRSAVESRLIQAQCIGEQVIKLEFYP